MQNTNSISADTSKSNSQRNPYSDINKSNTLDTCAKFLYHSLKDNQFIVTSKIGSGGTRRIYKFAQAKRGNKVYAYREQERVDCIQHFIDSHAHFNNQDNKTNVLFITLTQEYKSNEYDSIKESWQNMKKYVSKFMRLFKKEYDCKDYIVSFEAHEKGGCHAHIVALLPNMVQCWQSHGEKNQYIYRVNDDINDRIHLLYATACGHAYNVDVQGSYTSAVSSYLTKELGKFNCVEESLKRYFEGTDTAQDRKKIMTFGMAIKTHTRQLRVSRTIPRPQEISDNDLITNMNNSTDSTETFTVEKTITIERRAMKHLKITPYSYIVESDTEIYAEWHKIIYEGLRIENAKQEIL